MRALADGVSGELLGGVLGGVFAFETPPRTGDILGGVQGVLGAEGEPPLMPMGANPDVSSGDRDAALTLAGDDGPKRGDVLEVAKGSPRCDAVFEAGLFAGSVGVFGVDGEAALALAGAAALTLGVFGGDRDAVLIRVGTTVGGGILRDSPQ